MRTDDIVARVRSRCPGFEVVDHALVSETQSKYPGAYIAPVKAEAQPPGLLGTHSQMVREIVGVFITLERRMDTEAGLGTNDSLDDLRAQLRAALVNWLPPGAEQPLEYAGGELALRNGLASWREDFSTTFDMRMP